MDGYKRFTRVERIKFLLDNSYIKGSAKEYLNSKFYKDFNKLLNHEFLLLLYYFFKNRK